MGNYRSLVYFEVGLIATSVALFLSGLSSITSALDSTHTDWKNALLAFTIWMAAAIIVATIVAYFLQCRITHKRNAGETELKPELVDYISAFLPVIPGAIGIWPLAKFACANW